MRQDQRFHPGEAVSAPLFAGFLEASFDWLLTVDPHLHRIPALAHVYRIPARSLASATLLAHWIRDQIPDAIVIGPDRESEQWVADIARRAAVPYQVLNKIRHGDRDVEVSLPDVDAARGHTPVVVDDIVSSGQTLIETLRHLRRLGLPPTVCVVIHAVFAGDSYQQLLAAGADRVVSTDSIQHVSNVISIAELLVAGSADLFGNARREQMP
jgi:ribose-phosphate pyrophosphokinase